MTGGCRILGIGSPFGDDRAGWEACALLRARRRVGALASETEIRTLDRPGLLLVELLAGAESVILIDAVRSGAAIGAIHRLDGDRPGRARPLLSSHAGGVMEAVDLARALGELPLRLQIFGIEADAANSRDVLSPGVSAALPELVRQIEDRIMAWKMQRPEAW
jgi:hydrogenase maturation protease